MHIAILHYHLNRGGVTQVISNQLRGLAECGVAEQLDAPLAVLGGGRREGWQAPAGLPQLVTETVASLEYDQLRGGTVSGRALALAIDERLRGLEMRPESTVVHIHNHALGKNRAMLEAVGQLAGDGWRLLLQIHDFAEDFRPENERVLREAAGSAHSGRYPQASHIHYAVLNGRDFQLLADCGVARERLHLLPNAVPALGPLPSRTASRQQIAQRFDVPLESPWVVYPVRAIRRKNLGELLLWSTLFPQVDFAVTQPPLNPVEQPAYRRWVDLARELGLACHFGVADVGAGGLPFETVRAASDALLTTSVAEGFGMAFLETWLAGRELYGRNLPEITGDFEAAGLEFPGTYRALWMPLDWLGADRVRRELKSEFDRVLQSYGLPPVTAAEFERQWEEMVVVELIDFARLTPAAQADVIRRVASDPIQGQLLHQENPSLPLEIYFEAEQMCAHVEPNAARVAEHFGPVAAGRRLADVYQQLLAAPVSPLERLADESQLVHKFLDLKRFHPVRVGS